MNTMTCFHGGIRSTFSVEKRAFSGAIVLFCLSR